MSVKINGPIIQMDALESVNYLYWKRHHEEDELLSGFLIADQELGEEAFVRADAANGRFERCRFAGCTFEKGSFVDVVFDHCDFSNSVFAEAYFSRCEFLNCRCLGMDLHEAVLKHVQLLECQLSYANISGVLLEKVHMQSCDLTEAAFVETKYKFWSARDCRFIKTNFFHTVLRGFDFSVNTMEDIIVSDTMTELAGCKISAVQALEAARLLQMQVQ